jgi:hypothetical protein
MSWSQQVFSSSVTEVGYDDETEELLVTWKNGRTSAYKGVSEEKAQELANAPSVGSMIHSEIKPSYSHRYVR